MTTIEQSAAAMARYVAELERRVAELEALNATRNQQNAAAFAECDRLRDERDWFAVLAIHLRHCRECGETDVLHCAEGKPLWEAAMGGREGK